jgi:uncharacterized membrane protein YdjX (TVP38/TMEM64 family)
MEKTKKIKLFIGLFYIVLAGLFLYFFFSKFSLQEVISYDFIKNNREYFIELKEANLFLLALTFILFTIIWVMFAGFGSPVAIFAGFIFGKWLGLLFLMIGLSVGATGLYIFANYFLKELIKKKFLNKFQILETKFKKSEFTYLLIYRFVGGIPFAISNILPCMFNVKVSNFFLASFLGMIPQLFLVCSIGSGLEKVISQNLETPTILDLITSQEIYLPIIAFVVLVLVSLFLRKIFYK